ncbi:FAM96B protein [Auriscalpium vulgare]|uniref:FAM96B protein n=1 Tax=Auriscalpium vulgare TaxID=40419 RepID=A0ACB8RM11_9AGAM|nr:FAM96B protein [Auriscalpium vulgare]
MSAEAFNPNPTIVNTGSSWTRRKSASERHSLWITDEDEDDYGSDDGEEPIDGDEVFDLIRSISDPEHRSMTLEQLAVVSAPQVTVTNHKNHVFVEFTPTVPHCGMSTLIGLSIRVRLLRSLPTRFKVDIKVKPGSHQSENAVNKQLNDKERVAAALENPALVEVLETCLEGAGRRGQPADA